MTAVVTTAAGVGDSTNKYIQDMQDLLLNRNGALNPGQKAAALQIANDGTAFVQAAKKTLEKAQTYQV